MYFVCTDIEVNYTDDVGQTLLNWASAFGTQEMVFLFRFAQLAKDCK